MYSDSRNEVALLCDILGLESLVDSLESHRLASTSCHKDQKLNPTSSCILGPFYRPEAVILPADASIISDSNRDAYLPSTTYMTGRVLDTGGEPIPGATIDIWHTAPNGMYEQQDESQPDMDLRGRFLSDDNGRFSLYCLRPVAYPLPGDGPVAKLLKLMDRHSWRPSHLHFIVSAKGCRSVVTQLFDSNDAHLKNDAVFAVKQDLVINFVPLHGNEKAHWSLEFDFVLAKQLPNM